MNLQDYLDQQDYTVISLRATDFGHLEVPATINGIEVLLLVDTGAASTVIDLAFAGENNLHLLETTIKGGGVGTSNLVIHQLDGVELVVNGFLLQPFTIYAADLSHVKQSLLEKGETRLPSGVIGADILMSYKAVIDYRDLQLFLRKQVI